LILSKQVAARLLMTCCKIFDENRRSGTQHASLSKDPHSLKNLESDFFSLLGSLCNTRRPFQPSGSLKLSCSNSLSLELTLPPRPLPPKVFLAQHATPVSGAIYRQTWSQSALPIAHPSAQKDGLRLRRRTAHRSPPKTVPWYDISEVQIAVNAMKTS
jgi:hypothetical protein